MNNTKGKRKMNNNGIVVLLPQTEPISTCSGCGGTVGNFGGTAAR